MRTAAACFVLAAAIATPGIVVAATSSTPGRSAGEYNRVQSMDAIGYGTWVHVPRKSRITFRIQELGRRTG